MKEVVSCERMKQLDAYTIEKRGIPSCVLMERAALKTVEEMEKVFHKKTQKRRFSVSAEAEITEETELPLPGSFFFMDIRLRFMWQEITPLSPMKPRASFPLHQIIMFRL